MTEHKLWSTQQLADHFGLTTRRVNGLVREGMPQVGRGKFSPDAACQWFRAHENQLGKNAPSEKLDYYTEQARHTRAKAELAEIDLAKRRGALVELSAVLKIMERAHTAFKRHMLALPRKAAGRVIACSTLAEAESVIDHEVRDGLNELTRIAADLDTLTEPRERDESGDAKGPRASADPDGKRVGGSRKVSVSGGKRRARALADRPRRVSKGDHGRSK